MLPWVEYEARKAFRCGSTSDKNVSGIESLNSMVVDHEQEEGNEEGEAEDRARSAEWSRSRETDGTSSRAMLTRSRSHFLFLTSPRLGNGKGKEDTTLKIQFSRNHNAYQRSVPLFVTQTGSFMQDLREFSIRLFLTRMNRGTKPYPYHVRHANHVQSL